MKSYKRQYLKESDTMEETDKQYDGKLIDDYKMLKRLREIAVKENSVETVKAIDEE